MHLLTEFNYPFILIIGALALLVAVTAWVIHRYLGRVEGRRRKRLEKWRGFDAVPTSSPIDNHIREARKQSLQNLETRFNIIRKILFPLVIIVILLIITVPLLGHLPLSLVVAVTAAVVGIAARPYVENVISGLVITFSKVARIGDTVLVDDHYGTIEDISLTHTTIKRWDWRRYVVPNTRILSKEFLNYTLTDEFRWTYVEFYVSYESDMELVEKLAVEAARNARYFADYEQPRFWVSELEKEGIKCMVVGWVERAPQGWAFSVDVRKNLVRLFQQNGIKTHSLRHEWTRAGRYDRDRASDHGTTSPGKPPTGISPPNSSPPEVS